MHVRIRRNDDGAILVSAPQALVFRTYEAEIDQSVVYEVDRRVRDQQLAAAVPKLPGIGYHCLDAVLCEKASDQQELWIKVLVFGRVIDDCELAAVRLSCAAIPTRVQTYEGPGSRIRQPRTGSTQPRLQHSRPVEPWPTAHSGKRHLHWY